MTFTGIQETFIGRGSDYPPAGSYLVYVETNELLVLVRCTESLEHP